MLRGQFILSLIVLFSGGLIGGAISARIAIPTAHAEASKSITTHELNIIDDQGNTVATLGMRAGSPVLLIGEQANGVTIGLVDGRPFSVYHSGGKMVMLGHFDKDSYGITGQAPGTEGMFSLKVKNTEPILLTGKGANSASIGFANNWPLISCQNDDGRAVMAGLANGKPTIEIYSTPNRVTFKAP
jgi:hypothetical protein